MLMDDEGINILNKRFIDEIKKKNIKIDVNGKTIVLSVVPIHEIKPYCNNVRIHSVKQLTGLANSIEAFGFKSVIVIDRNKTIIAGHARYEAAAALGMKELLCIVADDLNQKEADALRIVDNKIAEQGGTDILALNIELERLADFDFTPYNIEFKPVKIPEPEEKKPEDEPECITCPRCNHEFVRG